MQKVPPMQRIITQIKLTLQLLYRNILYKNRQKTLPFDIFENLWFFFYIHISLINHTPGFHQPFLGESCLFQFCWFLRCLSQSQIDPEYLHHHYSKEKCLLKQMCRQVNELKILYYRYHPISSYTPRWSSQSNTDHSNTTVHLVRLHLNGDSSESHGSGAQQRSYSTYRAENCILHKK